MQNAKTSPGVIARSEATRQSMLLDRHFSLQ
jgi:hypothetical protein